MVTPSVKDITQHTECGNITNLNNSFTQATVAKPLQHNNEGEEQ